MTDWKGTLKKVAADLGFRASDEAAKKKKRGIDLSRWFPEKANRVSSLEPKPKIAAQVKRVEPSARPTPVPSVSQARVSIPATSAAKGVPERGEVATKTTARPAVSHSQRRPATATQSVAPAKNPAPTGGKRLDKKVFHFPNIEQLVVRFPDCRARPEWINIAAPSEVPGNVRELVCVLGLDFGTAFTKACIGVRGKHYFIHWDQCVDYPQTYLLPTFMTELGDGTCVLGTVQDDRGVVHSGLKMALLKSPTREQRLHTVVFFALAMQYARAWMWTKHSDVIAGFRLKWLINVGLPTSHWDAEQPIPELFRRIALAGWRLSFHTGPVRIEDAIAELDRTEDEFRTNPAIASKALEQIEAFPEFGAQIHSYSTASQSRKDLHFLVDVGAGTVDIVTFHVGRDDEDELHAIMDSSIETAGTHVLLQTRSDIAGLTNRSWNDADTRLSRAEFSKNHALAPGIIKTGDDDFTELLGLRLREVLSKTKTKRYSSAPNWGGLPYFLAGGGRDVDVYRNVPDEGARNLMITLQEMRFPLPDRASLELAGMPEKDFHRVSVAHGLSFDPINIKKTCRKKESENLSQRETSKPKFTDNFVDKSQV